MSDIDSENATENLQVRDNFKRLSNILETGKSQIIQNKELGEIYIDKGLTGKKVMDYLISSKTG